MHTLSNIVSIRPQPSLHKPSKAFLDALDQLEDAVAIPRDTFLKNKSSEIFVGLQIIGLALIDLQCAGRLDVVGELKPLVERIKVTAERLGKGDAA